jgi:cytochrome c553
MTVPAELPSSAAAAAAATSCCCCWSRGGAAAQILPKLAGQVDELKQHRLLPASSRSAQIADSTAQTREINQNNQTRFDDRE